MRGFIVNHKFGISLLSGLLLGAIIIRISGGCPIYRIFGVECLGCGMTHALLYALKLDFYMAFQYHPMFWSVPLIALFILFEGKLFKKKAHNTLFVAFIVTGFIIQYILKYKGIIGVS